VIFSRNRGSGRHAKGEDARQAPSQRDVDPDGDFQDEDDVQSQLQFGPYDVSEAPSGIAQLDLGSLQVPVVDGVEVRVHADNDGKIQQVVLVHEDSALLLAVYAAPRSEGIWDEVRGETRKQLFNDGVAAEEVEGDYGPELRARVRTPDGVTDMRFVGVDGPRWMVRAVYHGPAAIDPTASLPLRECLRNLVIARGQEAMPVRESLPLRLPAELMEQAQEAHDAEHHAEHHAEEAPAPANGGSPRRKPSPRPRRN
jgi:uncharacterized protein DUF3710